MKVSSGEIEFELIPGTLKFKLNITGGMSPIILTMDDIDNLWNLVDEQVDLLFSKAEES